MHRFFKNINHIHRENRERGVYRYMLTTSLKIVALYLAIAIPLILLAKRYIDFQGIFDYMAGHLSNAAVFMVFFVSESFLGLLPPDLFMIWAVQFGRPILVLAALGFLSYLGSIVSYFLGVWISKNERFNAYSGRKLDKYVQLARKWGGAFVVIAALFPFSPLSMVAIAIGMLQYPLKSYLLYGTSRIVRFVFQGFLYAGLFHLDKWITWFS